MLKISKKIGLTLVTICALSQSGIVFSQTRSCQSLYQKNNEEALAECSSLAENGDSDSQLAMGSYLGGLGKTEAAMKWLKMAALQGDTQAIEGVRIKLSEQAQMSSSSAEMLEFLLKVVKVPSLDSNTVVVTQAQICQAYREGIGTVIDYKSAVYWCEQSAKNGGAKAAWELINFHKNGLGVPKNPKKAEALWQDYLVNKILPIAEREPQSVVTWHESAAKIGICSASKQLATMHEKGLYNLQPSMEKSKEWLRYTEKCKAIE